MKSKSFINLPQTPNARLGSDSLSVDNSSFGSTQLAGCQGDFCSYDIKQVENKDLNLESNSSSSLKLSEFRTKLMKNDEYFSLDGKAKDTTSSNNSQRLISKNTPFTIPSRVVIQARQEMSLVKLALERHRRGEIGDYISEENYNDLALSGKLPSLYYKDLPCCENCFKIYNIVEDARNSALAKLSSKQQQHRKNKSGFMEREPNRFNDSQTIASASYSKGTKRSYEAAALDSSSNKSQINTVSGPEDSLKKVVQLVESLTKLDIAEIRTMTKPPAAVEIVLEAVMILLTGKVMSFSDIRKLMGSGRLHSFITFIHSLHTFIHSLHTYIHYIHSFIHSLHSFIHYIHSFIHSFITFIHYIH